MIEEQKTRIIRRIARDIVIVGWLGFVFVVYCAKFLRAMGDVVTRDVNRFSEALSVLERLAGFFR